MSRGFLSAWAAQLLARLLSIVASVVSLAVLSRHLGVSQFGTWTAVAAWVALLSPLSDLGLPTTLLREAPAGRLSEEVSEAAGLQLVLALPSLVVATTAGALLLHGRAAGALGLLVASSCLAPNALYLLAQVPLTHARQFRLTAVVEAVARVGTAALTVVLVLLGVRLPWLFVVLSVPSVLGVAGLAVLAGRSGRHGLRPRFDPRQWAVLLRRGLPVGASLALFAVYLKADAVLLSVLAGPAAVGAYGLAYRVVEVVLSVPALFMVVAYPRLVEVAADPVRLRELATRSLHLLSLLGGLVVVVGLPLSGTVLGVLGGDDYRFGARALSLLLLSTALSFATPLLGQLLILRGESGRLFRFSVLNVALNVALNLVLIPPFGATGAAAATVVTEGLAVLVVGGHLSRARVLAPSGRVLLPAVAALGLGLASTAALARWNLPAAVVVGAALYVGLSSRSSAARQELAVLRGRDV